jgi:hypothetical protein
MIYLLFIYFCPSFSGVVFQIPNPSTIKEEQITLTSNLSTFIPITANVILKHRPIIIEILGSVVIKNRLGRKIEIKQGEVFETNK